MVCSDAVSSVSGGRISVSRCRIPASTVQSCAPGSAETSSELRLVSRDQLAQVGDLRRQRQVLHLRQQAGGQLDGPSTQPMLSRSSGVQRRVGDGHRLRPRSRPRSAAVTAGADQSGLAHHQCQRLWPRVPGQAAPARYRRRSAGGGVVPGQGPVGGRRWL